MLLGRVKAGVARGVLDSKRSHFVPSYGRLDVLLGCVWLLLELGMCRKSLI